MTNTRRKPATARATKGATGGSKTRAKKSPAAAGTITRTKVGAKPSEREGKGKDAREKPRVKAPTAGEGVSVAPSEKTRVVFPWDTYNEHKDEIKKFVKEFGLKWQYFGPGKGRWAGTGVQVVLQSTDVGQDLTVSGEPAKVARVLEIWKPFAGSAQTVAATAEVAGAEASDALSMWELDRPVRQSGEPEGFYARRLADWEKRDPRKPRK